MSEIAATRARKRCAVYCRVSSDERLDQEFNSIDAQKEAGHAYVASQRSEGWIPVADDYDLYGVYPAIDACVALSELIHSRLSGETLEHAIEVSKSSITTVAMLEMTQAGREMTDEELKENPAVEQEWDIQWEIFRLLADCEERDIELIKGLRADLREAGESNIGINFQQ